MTLNHNEATAIVTIDGLAICCFDHTSNNWDLAFLHNDDPQANPSCPHHLILKVSDQQGIALPNSTDVITFTAENTPPLDYSQPHDGLAIRDGFFDKGVINDRTEPPLTADDLENFRWVLDLEDPQQALGVTGLMKPSVQPTRAFISNAIFYTAAISPGNLFLLKDGDDPNVLSGGQLGKFLFGRTNDLIGADILAPGGQVVVKVGSQEVARLPHVPGKPWQISLTNLCVPHPTGNRLEKGDFHLFYDALAFRPPKLAIWGEPRALAKAALSLDQVTGRTDCDTTFVSTSPNLDLLFQ